MEKLRNVIVVVTLRLLVTLIIGGCGWMKLSTYAQEIRIFPGKSGPTINIPSQSTPLSSTAVLICGIEPISSNVTQLNYTSRWTTPAGEVVNFTNSRFSFFEGQAIINSTRRYPATILWVKRMTYRDAGVYTCEGRTDPTAPWVAATIDLRLGLELESLNSTVTVTTNTDNERAELSCEMSAFIRADSSLIWEGPNARRITADGAMNKYQITFSNGTADRSVNGTRPLAPSRVSTLYISNLEPSDTGDYTCSVVGTDQAVSISLVVDGANSADDVDASGSIITTTDLLSTTPLLVGGTNLTAVIAGSVAAALGLLVILTIATVALCTLVYKNKRVYKAGTTVISDNNYVYPIYDYPTNILANLNNEYKTVNIRSTDANNTSVGGHSIEDLHRIEAYAVSNLKNENSYDFTDDNSDGMSHGSTDIILERNEAYGEVVSKDCGNVNDIVYAEID